MKRLTILSMTLVLVAAAAAHAGPVIGLDVTDPADTIVRIDGADDGDGQLTTPGGDNPPPNETVENAIDDDDGTKYLNFLDLGSGFQVTLDTYGPAALTGIALTTANDSPARDPASVTITGSNNGIDWFPIITDLATPLSDDRFAEAEFYFTPETAGTYSMYEVVFPTLKDAATANSMQIGEVRLLPEPATLALVGFGAAAMALRRRRK